MNKSLNHKQVIDFLLKNSMFLIFGTITALIWANSSHESYEHLKHFVLIRDFPVGTLQADGSRVLDLHYLVNDILMAFFFAIAGKEVWEATCGRTAQ
jgi:NhaA family Na+:H+ antiporter